MIAPNLATMLVFVTTDAPVPPAAVHELATSVLEPAFESLTVDACTSTNDTVLLFASGAAGGDPVAPGSQAWATLADALDGVADSLCISSRPTRRAGSTCCSWRSAARRRPAMLASLPGPLPTLPS